MGGGHRQKFNKLLKNLALARLRHTKLIKGVSPLEIKMVDFFDCVSIFNDVLLICMKQTLNESYQDSTSLPYPTQ